LIPLEIHTMFKVRSFSLNLPQVTISSPRQ
jgi:hypothetical protein